jgi:hypothetical protein
MFMQRNNQILNEISLNFIEIGAAEFPRKVTTPAILQYT